jgi:hypothetical protein
VATRRAGAKPARTTTYGHGDLGASLVLIFPLLLAYEVGVAFAGHVSGVDVVTRALYTACGSRAAYLAFHAAVALAFLVYIRRANRWSTLRLDVAGPTILEAALYALTLGAVARLVVEQLLGLGLGGTVVSALGAGIHEELVFRLAILSGIAWLLRKLPRGTIAIALAASSVIFAAAHHAGAHGEPWSAHAFAFRCVAGAVFGLIFWYRSLAHAVYAHVIYDVLVLAG